MATARIDEVAIVVICMHTWKLAIGNHLSAIKLFPAVI